MAASDPLTAEAAALFEKLQWPVPADEEWRRTDLSRLLAPGVLDGGAEASRVGGADGAGRTDDGMTDLPAPLLPETYAARIITEAGRPVGLAVSKGAAEAGLTVEWVERSENGEFPDGVARMGASELSSSPERVTAWHWRDAAGILVLRVPRGVRIGAPVAVEERLIAAGAEEALVSVPHLHAEVGESAALTVIWSFEGSPTTPASVTPMVNAGLSAAAGADATVDVTLRQSLGDRVVFFLHDRLEAARDARLRFREAHFGGALVKTRTRAVLNGPGSEAMLKGLYLVSEGRHMDIGTLQEHRSPNAVSDALYKGAVRPGGRSVFQGLIEVAPHASKTDAYLTNNNLVLGDGARADSLPQLNILTDDVKCSHGSTTGKLDETQLFYLRSRGFSPEEARRELTRGFLAGILGDAPGAVAEVLSADLDAALAFGQN